MDDTEAIAWAYQKLLAFGVGGSNMESAMMLDKLNEMLQAAPTPPAPEVEPFEEWAKRELDVDCNTCNHADMQAARKLYEAHPANDGLRKAALSVLDASSNLIVDTKFFEARNNLRAELNKDKSC